MAFIEPDVSVTSITEAFSTGTAMVASGRASAVTRPASDRHSSAGGMITPRAAGPADDRGQRGRRRGSG